MDSMEALIARLEAADEGSRELDEAIASECGTKRWVQSSGEPDPGIFGDQELYWPYYTTSLDAALTLVPKGWHGYVRFGEIQSTDDFRAAMWSPDKAAKESFFGPAVEEAATPALALCIAALKARQTAPVSPEDARQRLPVAGDAP